MFLEQENFLFPDLRKSALQLGPLRHAILQGLGKSGQVMSVVIGQVMSVVIGQVMRVVIGQEGR